MKSAMLLVVILSCHATALLGFWGCCGRQGTSHRLVYACHRNFAVTTFPLNSTILPNGIPPTTSPIRAIPTAECPSPPTHQNHRPSPLFPGQHCRSAASAPALSHGRNEPRRHSSSPPLQCTSRCIQERQALGNPLNALVYIRSAQWGS